VRCVACRLWRSTSGPPAPWSTCRTRRYTGRETGPIPHLTHPPVASTTPSVLTTVSSRALCLTDLSLRVLSCVTRQCTQPVLLGPLRTCTAVFKWGVRFQVLTQTKKQMAVFWDVAPYCQAQTDRDVSAVLTAAIIRAMSAALRNIPHDSHLRIDACSSSTVGVRPRLQASVCTQ
jgi:hypothetical protein